MNGNLDWYTFDNITYHNPIGGCTDQEACNFDSNLTFNDGSCSYPEENFDCDGNCTVTIDCAGTCGGSAVEDECGDCDGSGPAENFSCDGFKPETKATLQAAVDMWVSSPESTEATYGHISDWDVSLITDMYQLFKNKVTFNDDISNWDVSNVSNMRNMFYDAESFDQDLSNWDVSSVTNMWSMFDNALAFNGDISSWDVSNVTNMRKMFENADSFNGDLSSWDVSNVTNMSGMFRDQVLIVIYPLGMFQMLQICILCFMMQKVLIKTYQIGMYQV